MQTQPKRFQDPTTGETGPDPYRIQRGQPEARTFSAGGHIPSREPSGEPIGISPYRRARPAPVLLKPPVQEYYAGGRFPSREPSGESVGITPYRIAPRPPPPPSITQRPEPRYTGFESRPSRGREQPSEHEVLQERMQEASRRAAQRREIQTVSYGVGKAETQAGLYTLSKVLSSKARRKPEVSQATVSSYMGKMGFAPVPGWASESVKKVIQPTSLSSPETVAGFTAAFESPALVLAKLGGYKVPEPEPTLVGSLIGSGLAGRETAELEYVRTHPQYAIGNVAGEIAFALFLGKVTSPATEEVTSRITQAWRGSRPEKWLIKHSGWYAAKAAKTISPMVVDIPNAPFGKAAVEAEDVAWELTIAPRTAGIMVTKQGSKISEFVGSHWVKHVMYGEGGTRLIGVLRERVETVQPQMPYIPKTDFMAGTKPTLWLTPSFVTGFSPEETGYTPFYHAVFSVPRVRQRIAGQLSVKREERVKPVQFTRETAISRLASRVVPFVWEEPIEYEAMLPRVVPIAGVKTSQLVREVQEVPLQTRYASIYSFPLPSHAYSYMPRQYPDYTTHRKEVLRRRKKALGVGRYSRKYPVLTAKRMMRMMIGK